MGAPTQPDGNGVVPAPWLHDAVGSVFEAVGFSAGAARSVAEALVEADMRGVASHGTMLVPMYIDRIRAGSVSRREQAEVVVDAGAIAVLDAGHALGQLTGDQAMALAVEKASAFGIGAVTVRRAFHFGGAFRYVESAVRAGCVGIAAANTRPLMPAIGGAKPVVGNNPLAVGVPTRAGTAGGAGHGALRGRPGQDPARRAGRPGDPADLGLRRAGPPDHRPAGGHRGNAAARRRPQGLRARPDHRRAHRCALRRRVRPGGSRAVRRPDGAQRLRALLPRPRRLGLRRRSGRVRRADGPSSPPRSSALRPRPGVERLLLPGQREAERHAVHERRRGSRSGVSVLDSLRRTSPPRRGVRHRSRVDPSPARSRTGRRSREHEGSASTRPARSLLVTGGASGIGAALARAVRGRPAARRWSSTCATPSDLDGAPGVRQLAVDVSDRDAVARPRSRRSLVRHGHIDGLVAGAAIQPRTPVGDHGRRRSGGGRSRSTSTASSGPARPSCPHMVARRSRLDRRLQPPAWPTWAGPRPRPTPPSKGALVAFAKSLAAEVAEHRIRVNIVCPRASSTPRSSRPPTPPAASGSTGCATTGIGTPEDVVGPLLFLLSDAATMTGSTAHPRPRLPAGVNRRDRERTRAEGDGLRGGGDPAGRGVGAGPIGLITALGLAHHGVPVVVFEEDDRLSLDTKAGTMLTRTLEVLHRYGALARRAARLAAHRRDRRARPRHQQAAR